MICAHPLRFIPASNRPQSALYVSGGRVRRHFLALGWRRRSPGRSVVSSQFKDFERGGFSAGGISLADTGRARRRRLWSAGQFGRIMVVMPGRAAPGPASRGRGIARRGTWRRHRAGRRCLRRWRGGCFAWRRRRRGCWTTRSPWCSSGRCGRNCATGRSRCSPPRSSARSSPAVCTRSRYAEDRLAAGAFAQYVILGAGLDSFAWRRPDLLRSLRVFEVDHPASQAWKLERVSGLALPLSDSQVFVPADFEAGSSPGRLARGRVRLGPAGAVLLDRRRPLSHRAGDRVDVAHDRGGRGRLGGGVLLPGRGARAR